MRWCIRGTEFRGGARDNVDEMAVVCGVRDKFEVGIFVLQLCPLEDWLTYIHTGRVAPIHGPETELPQVEPEQHVDDPGAHETDDWEPQQAADVLLSDEVIMGAFDSGNETVPRCLQLAGGLSPLAPWAHFTLRSKVVERAIRLAMIVELAGRHYDWNRQEFPARGWDV